MSSVTQDGEIQEKNLGKILRHFPADDNCLIFCSVRTVYITSSVEAENWSPVAGVIQQVQNVAGENAVETVVPAGDQPAAATIPSQRFQCQLPPLSWPGTNQYKKTIYILRD